MAGLFEALGTPAARQEAILRKALEARRDAWPHTRYLYRGGGDYLLRHGQFFAGAELPAEYAHLKGGEGECFANALLACEADPSLRYFEGVYEIGGGAHYTPHAWAVTQDGRLCEVTMPTDPATIAIGREFASKLPIRPVEHWGYWGVEFDPAFVRAYWATHNGLADDGRMQVGILDRPTHDARTGNEEWREDWPIYSYPYDPKRTEP